MNFAEQGLENHAMRYVVKYLQHTVVSAVAVVNIVLNFFNLTIYMVEVKPIERLRVLAISFVYGYDVIIFRR